MVITGFMFNYMLRVNLTIAIVEMVQSVATNSSATNSTNSTTAIVPVHNHHFNWTASQVKILPVHFYEFILHAENNSGETQKSTKRRAVYFIVVNLQLMYINTNYVDKLKKETSLVT